MSSVAIIGAQWGDEGKGKIVDALAETADLVARFQGGDNAGHTVYSDGKKHVFHLLPSGILRPKVLCVIGGGVALNLERLVKELEEVGLPEAEWPKRLRISAEAHLILPCHIALDKAGEKRRGDSRIGTTLRGIGPAYTDRAARTGVRMGDTLDEAHFKAMLKTCLEGKKPLLDDEDYRQSCDVNAVAAQTLALARRFASVVCDTSLVLDEAVRAKKNILFEGAQGTMLDVGMGTYPFVTSSHTVAGGVCVGAGVGPGAVHKVLGVTKAYATRVGEGPFPTELKDETGEFLRKTGGEYGATTGRPRRCGWLDVVALRRAVRVNGIDELVLTKLDVLNTLDEIKVCTAYRCRGGRLTEWPVNPADVAALEPEWETVPGWKAPTENAKSFRELPKPARDYIRDIEQWLGVPVSMISSGKDRSQLIIRSPVWKSRHGSTVHG